MLYYNHQYLCDLASNATVSVFYTWR